MERGDRVKGWAITTILGVTLVIFSTTVSQAEMGQGNFYVGAQCATPSSVNDHLGNPLPIGDLVQVIYSGSDGIADAPDPTKPDYIGGDDVIVHLGGRL